jgi:hypothetical protein
MDSIYVFKYAPSSIKRLISLYLIGLGTPTSQLIKDAYNLLYEANKNNIIVNEHMSYYIDRDIGFRGCRMSSKKTANHSEYSKDLFKRYFNRRVFSEEFLMPLQMYEISIAKLFYLCNYTNIHKHEISFSVRGDNSCLGKLFKYKYLQLTREE